MNTSILRLFAALFALTFVVAACSSDSGATWTFAPVEAADTAVAFAENGQEVGRDRRKPIGLFAEAVVPETSVQVLEQVWSAPRNLLVDGHRTGEPAHAA